MVGRRCRLRHGHGRRWRGRVVGGLRHARRRQRRRQRPRGGRLQVEVVHCGHGSTFKASKAAIERKGQTSAAKGGKKGRAVEGGGGAGEVAGRGGRDVRTRQRQRIVCESQFRGARAGETSATAAPSPFAPVPLANGPPIDRERLAEAVGPTCRRGGRGKGGGGQSGCAHQGQLVQLPLRPKQHWQDARGARKRSALAGSRDRTGPA